MSDIAAISDIVTPFPVGFGQNTPRLLARLTERYKRIITPNLPWIEGKRILDLAANNGRWTWAALDAGASHVTAVEGRQDQIDLALKIFAQEGRTEGFTYLQGDVYDYLWAQEPGRFDTIFCLGFYYHIMDHYMLMRLMARQQPECIIIDSGFLPTFALEVWVQGENPAHYSNAMPAYPNQELEIAGQVSLGLMVEMARNCGYRVEPIAWKKTELEWPRAAADYQRGRRFTLRLLRTSQEELQAEDWKTRWREALEVMGLRVGKILDKPLAAMAEQIEERQNALENRYGKNRKGEI